MAQVPTSPPNLGAKQAGAQGTLDRPSNPWDPSGGWDVVYDGQTFSGDPLIVEEQANVLIINCTFQNIEGVKEALFLMGSERVLVLNNTFSGHRYEGHGSAITVGTDDFPAAQVIIENNTISDEDGNGIATGGASRFPRQGNPVPGLIIRDNLIHDVGKYPDPAGNSPKHGMYVKATDPLVENNMVYNCFDGSGLSIRSTGLYRNNMVWNTKGAGIVYWPQKDPGESGRLIIENNVVYQDGNYNGPENNRSALWLGVGEVDSSRFDNFTVRFNTVAMLAGAESRINTASVMNLSANFYRNVKAYGNAVVDLRPGLNRPLQTAADFKYAYLDHNYTATSDEGFASVANRDFRLTADHPAVDYVPASATLPGYPATDRAGNSRQYPLDAGAYTLSESTNLDPELGQVTVRARGTTGSERIELRYNDQPVGEPITLSTSYQTYQRPVDQANGNFKVAFVNDQGDSDVYVDWLQVGEVRHQANLQDINTGAWADGVCGGGTRTEVLHCNGYIDFGTLDSETVAGEVVVGVQGRCGGEDVRLNIDGTTVATWYDVGVSATTRTYQGYEGGTIQVAFFDNGIDQAGCDRNLEVDYVRVNGTRYETEEVATAHPEYADCNTPDVMRCNGYFDFGDRRGQRLADATATRTQEKRGQLKQLGSELALYPNPAQNTLRVSNTAGQPVHILTLWGKTVLTSRENRLDVSTLRPGTYIVRVGQQSKPLIIQ